MSSLDVIYCYVVIVYSKVKKKCVTLSNYRQLIDEYSIY